MSEMTPLRSETRDGMHIDWDMPIRMSDGTLLRCDVFRPLAEGRYPVLLAASPYAKWLAFQDPDVWGGQWKMLCRHEPEILRLSSNRYQNYEFPDPERFVPDGYALVRVDVRGTGRSPGVLDCYSARETQDLYECIEWAGTQPWSTGKVGLSGVSYLASNQWQVAALRPPHLAAICVWEGCSDFYREFTRHGAILSGFSDLWYARYVLPVQHGRGERGWKSNINGEWVAGPQTLPEEALAANRRDWRSEIRRRRLATDEFWTSRLPDFGGIEVPLLSAANWGGHGLHLRGNVEGFVAAGSREKWLDFHCYEHWTEYYTSRGIALQKRFLGHFLKGEDNGWGRQPKVMMQVRHPEKPFAPRGETAWPLAGTQWTKAYLTSRGALEWQPAQAGQPCSFRAAGNGVTFLSAPLEHDLHVIGPSAAKLFAAASSEDADLFLIVRLFTADLKEITYSGANEPHTPMAHGWLRASHRKLDRGRSLPYRPWHPHDEVQPLAPNEPVELDIEIWPTCFVAPAGYRIALTIRGKDYEYPGDLGSGIGPIGQPATGVGPFRHIDPDDRPAAVFDNEITLRFDEGKMPYLLLPVVPPASPPPR